MKKIIILSAFFLLTSALVSAQSVTISGVHSVCTNGSFTLTANFTGVWNNKTYVWYRGTNLIQVNYSISNTNTFNISSANGSHAGDYSVKVWNYDSTALVTSNTHSLTVNPLNTLTIVSGQANQTVCKNDAITTIVYSTTGATGIGSVTGLPAGVTAAWASNTLTISGTPTSAGNFNYTIPLTGGCGTVNATGTITVIATNTVSAASSSPQPCENTLMNNITHSTTGATGIGLPTGLPAGVTAAWAFNTITISGTPTASGTFNYSIPLTGGCGSTLYATGTITVKPAHTLNLTSGQQNASVCLGDPLPATSYTFGGGATNASVSGLSGSGLGSVVNGNILTISGTPQSSTTYTVTTSGNSCSPATINGSVSLITTNTVSPPSATPTVCINTPMVTITHTTGGATGIGAATGLPAGVTATWASNTITISGTPTAPGTYNYSIPLTGGCGATINAATGTITVKLVHTLNLTSGQQHAFVCQGDPLPATLYTFGGGATGASVSGLSGSGLGSAINGNILTISGTPQSSTTYTVTTSGNSCSPATINGSVTLITTNTVSPPSATPTVCINTPMDTITHTTGGATGIGAATGLPAGVTATWASNTITISGTPAATGTFNYSIPLTGGCGATINAATGTITVNSCCDPYINSFITANSGFFTDGCDQQPYNNSSYCQWYIIPEGAESIYIRFPSSFFDIKEGDKIKIWDGPDTNFLLVGSYDNSSLPPAIIQTGVPMFVEFITDDTIEGNGFKAEYWTNISADISQISMIDNIKIYPNPATHSLTIEAPGESVIEIINMEGQLIQSLTTVKSQTNTDVSGFSAGMYFVKVRTGRGVVVEKFVKK